MTNMKNAAWDKLPPGWTQESVQKMWNTMTGKHERKITQCMKKMEGKVSNTGAFCGSLASQVGYRKSKTAEIVPEESRTRSLFSNSAMVLLRRAFGPRALPFFTFYDLVRRIYDGSADAPPSGLVNTYIESMRIIQRMTTRESTRVQIADALPLFRTLLPRLEDGSWDRMQAVRFSDVYTSMVREVAADKGVYLAEMSSGDTIWPAFRKMNESEQKLEELRLSDIETYEQATRSKDFIRQVHKNIEQEILDLGMAPSTVQLMGRRVNIGLDPVSGDEVVFDVDGDLLTKDQYVTKHRQIEEAQRNLTKTFPDIKDIRKLSDEMVDVLTSGEIQYVAMTDDKAKVNALTRIYPTKKTMDGKVVVVSGRFKGCFMEDLVNLNGRMIEGVSMSPNAKGVFIQNDVKNPDGTLKIKKINEPYVTVMPDGRLMIRIPSANNELDKHLRGEMLKLSQANPAIHYEKDSRRSIYLFKPSEFAAIRSALGGIALSQAAARVIQKFSLEQAKHELATSEENVKNFEADKIGGFKPGIKLFKKQKEAMAWLESRKLRGVIALDTGAGKTLMQIASMMKSIRDGLIEPGQKFLCVCPPALKNNIAKQAVEMLEDPDQFLAQVDVISYTEFSKRVSSDPDFAARYAAVYFDEAQALKSVTSTATRAATALRHPNKILLTASPMEKSPLEVLTLVSITQGVNLGTKEGKGIIKAFKERFCEEVGGKIVGIKKDPAIAKEFRIWVKSNLYFADKRRVEEVALPTLRSATMAITMDPEVEALYKMVTKRHAKVLQGLVAKYRDRSPNANDPALENARVRLAKDFKLMFELANMPWKHVPGAKSPKFEQLKDIVDERVAAGRRTLVFTDSPELASVTAKDLSEKFPGKIHAECGSSSIKLWKNGKVQQSYGKKAYQDGDRTWPADNWKGFVLDRVIQADPKCLTCVLTASYAVGQNLQSFDTVVHLDRDAWNSETMKQRTARAWRTGQDQAVDEVVLDVVFESPDGANDATTDEIAGYVQRLEEGLFDEVIKNSQSEALGKDWFEMEHKHASFQHLNRQVMQLTTSPYARNIGKVGIPGSIGTRT